jgi:hypothetical protein
VWYALLCIDFNKWYFIIKTLWVKKHLFLYCQDVNLQHRPYTIPKNFHVFSMIFPRISVSFSLLCVTLGLVFVMETRISPDVGIIHFIKHVPKFQLTYINFNLILTVIVHNFLTTYFVFCNKYFPKSFPLHWHAVSCSINV